MATLRRSPHGDSIFNFSKWLHDFNSHQHCTQIPHPYQHFLLSGVGEGAGGRRVAILLEMKCITLVLISISLMINDVEHPMCLLAIFVSSLDK